MKLKQSGGNVTAITRPHSGCTVHSYKFFTNNNLLSFLTQSFEENTIFAQTFRGILTNLGRPGTIKQIF